MSDYRDNYQKSEREYFWTLPRAVIAFLALLVCLYAIGFLATGGDLAIYRFWAPKQAEAENTVFHKTQQYIDGKNVYIGQLCRERVSAHSYQRLALSNEILSEADTVDTTKLSATTQSCIQDVKGN